MIDFLAQLPTTNLRLAATVLLIVLTGLTVIVTRFLDHAWTAPAEAWLGFLLLLAGVDTTHFFLKRKTTWQPNGQKTEETSTP